MNHKENLNDPEQPSGVLGSDPIQSTENDADQAAEATVSRKAKLDILFGLGGITVSVFALIEALKMPVEELYNCKWYTAPAMLPIICSVIVGGLCLVLVFQSFRRCGGIQKQDVSAALAYFKSKQFLRLLLAIALLTIYLFVPLGRVHYILATFLYLFASMFLFRDKTLVKHIVLLLVLSLTVSIAVGLCFSELAKIPLP